MYIIVTRMYLTVSTHISVRFFSHTYMHAVNIQTEEVDYYHY